MVAERDSGEAASTVDSSKRAPRAAAASGNDSLAFAAALSVPRRTYRRRRWVESYLIVTFGSQNSPHAAFPRPPQDMIPLGVPRHRVCGQQQNPRRLVEPAAPEQPLRDR